MIRKVKSRDWLPTDKTIDWWNDRFSNVRNRPRTGIAHMRFGRSQTIYWCQSCGKYEWN